MVLNDELFVQQNSLNQVLQTHNDQTDQPKLIQRSSYYDSNHFSRLAKKATYFSISSTNIQSVHAKFYEIQAYVLELNL